MHRRRQAAHLVAGLPGTGRTGARPSVAGLLGLALVAAALLAGPPASAGHDARPTSTNLYAVSESPHPARYDGVPVAERQISSDLAFWGDLAVHGNYDGFRLVDVSRPDTPELLSHVRCDGDQGDVVVWEDLVVRSWNSPAPDLGDGTSGRRCDGQPVPPGFEGLHLFDIADPARPALVAAVALPCGSHTATVAPDLANDRLIVYSNVSEAGSRSCAAQPGFDAIDIVAIPLDEPAAAARIGQVPLAAGSQGSNRGCHDAAVILGDANLLACASGHAANVFSIGLPHGGTLTEPRLLHTIEEADAAGNRVGEGGRWHSAAFTWDGEVLVLGWEPGGGGQARCREQDPDIDKSLFFYDAASGTKLGQWALPAAQSAQENCTIHDFSVVPLRDGSYVAVSGNYQAGTWVTEFTDPANPRTVAWADPPPSGVGRGGAWASYHYRGFLYESNMEGGLFVFRASDRALTGALRLDHLNPQTQPFTIPCRYPHRHQGLGCDHAAAGSGHHPVGPAPGGLAGPLPTRDRAVPR